MRGNATVYAWISDYGATVYAWITWVVHRLFPQIAGHLSGMSWGFLIRPRERGCRALAGVVGTHTSVGLFQRLGGLPNVRLRWRHQQAVVTFLHSRLGVNRQNLAQLA